LLATACWALCNAIPLGLYNPSHPSRFDQNQGVENAPAATCPCLVVTNRRHACVFAGGSLPLWLQIRRAINGSIPGCGSGELGCSMSKPGPIRPPPRVATVSPGFGTSRICNPATRRSIWPPANRCFHSTQRSVGCCGEAPVKHVFASQSDRCPAGSRP